MDMRASWGVWFLLLALPLLSADAVNDRPIIGILTQPLGVELGSSQTLLDTYNRTYVASSYVKWAESAGARVVPIHFDASNDELRTLVGKINGIIFPGGGASFVEGTRFLEAGQLLYNLTMEANSGTERFPLHGTGLGFQLLQVITAQDHSVLCSGCFDSDGQALPLEFTTVAWKNSSLFKYMPEPLYLATAWENLTQNSHHSGVVPEQYTKNANLNKFYYVCSTNLDYQGKRFVSTVEAKNYPITATQWHPEKNNFEFWKVGKLGITAIPHSAHAVQLSQYLANHFVDSARQSSRHFASEKDEAETLIENCPPVQDPNGYFSGIHMWDREHKCLSQENAFRSQEMLVV